MPGAPKKPGGCRFPSTAPWLLLFKTETGGPVRPPCRIGLTPVTAFLNETTPSKKFHTERPLTAALVSWILVRFARDLRMVLLPDVDAEEILSQVVHVGCPAVQAGPEVKENDDLAVRLVGGGADPAQA